MNVEAAMIPCLIATLAILTTIVIASVVRDYATQEQIDKPAIWLAEHQKGLKLLLWVVIALFGIIVNDPYLRLLSLVQMVSFVLFTISSCALVAWIIIDDRVMKHVPKTFLKVALRLLKELPFDSLAKLYFCGL